MSFHTAWTLAILLFGVTVVSSRAQTDPPCDPPKSGAKSTGKCVPADELDRCDGLTIVSSNCVPHADSRRNDAFCCFEMEPRTKQSVQASQSSSANMYNPGSPTSGPVSGATTPSSTPTTSDADDSGFPCPFPENPDCEGNNPSRPQPAPGYQGPPNYYPQFSDADGSPVDTFSGMSRKGWILANETLNMMLRQSAVATNMSNPDSLVQQLRAFSFARMYIETCYFSMSRGYSTLDPTLGCEVIWVKSFLDRDKIAGVAIQRLPWRTETGGNDTELLNGYVKIKLWQFVGQVRNLAAAAVNQDWGPYFALADDLAFNIHYQIEKGTFTGPGLPPGTKIKIGLGTFLENCNANVYMCRFLLGDQCTYERESTIIWVFYLVGFLNWHFLNLYEFGVKSRLSIEDFTMYTPPSI